MSDAPRKLELTDLISEISATRARLSRRLSVLDRDYALRHLFVRVTRFARHPQSFAAAREKLRRDAVPLGLIGIGLGWLSYAGRANSGEVLHRIMTGIASLQDLARELGLLPKRDEPSAPSASLPAPEGEIDGSKPKP